MDFTVYIYSGTCTYIYKAMIALGLPQHFQWNLYLHLQGNDSPRPAPTLSVEPEGCTYIYKAMIALGLLQHFQWNLYLHLQGNDSPRPAPTLSVEPEGCTYIYKAMIALGLLQHFHEFEGRPDQNTTCKGSPLRKAESLVPPSSQ